MPVIKVYKVTFSQDIAGAPKVTDARYSSANILKALQQGNTDAQALTPAGEVVSVALVLKIDKDAP